MVDEKRVLGQKGVVFKIVFKKAYDHVEWDFLDQAIERKGFSTSFMAEMNDNAKGWVKATRRLRQGDVSHFLFTIAIDVLSRMILKAKESGILEGFLVGSSIRVFHLQFVDDIFSSKCQYGRFAKP